MRIRTRMEPVMSKAKAKRLLNRGHPGNRVRIKKSPEKDLYNKGFEEGKEEGRKRVQRKYDYDADMWNNNERVYKKQIQELEEENEAYLRDLDNLEKLITYEDSPNNSGYPSAIKAEDLIKELYKKIEEMHQEDLSKIHWIKVLENKIKGMEVAFSISPEEGFFFGDTEYPVPF